MSMSTMSMISITRMIDRPRLLLRYCQNSNNYTENQKILLGISNYLQCIKTSVPVHELSNSGAGRAPECRSMRKQEGIC